MKIDPSSYRKTFFEEAAEHLNSLEACLLRLEAGPHDPEALNDAFRSAHSIKGGSDAVGFPAIASFTHGLEGLLDQLRGSNGPVPPRIIDLLLEASDALTSLVTSARTETQPPPGTDEVRDRLIAEKQVMASNKTDSKHDSRHEARSATVVNSSTPADRFWIIDIEPRSDSYLAGLDPMLLLRDLMRLGSIENLVQTSELPEIDQADPERCLLKWRITLRTKEPVDAIQDVFMFAEDNVRFSVSEGAVAPSHVPESSSRSSRIARRVPDSIRFGLFLVRGGASGEKVLEAMEWGRTNRPLLGDLAVRSNKMTVKQRTAVLQDMRDYERFGEAAVRLGFLTPADVGLLLMVQEKETPTLDQSLVGLGVVDRVTIDGWLERFQTELLAPAKPQANGVVEPAPEAEAVASTSLDLSPPASGILAVNAEMIGEFCSEASEHIEASDRNLLILDSDPTNQEALNAVYRAFHTIKGVAGMLDLNAVRFLAHEAENLLNLAREGKIVLRGQAMDLAFASADGLKRQIGFFRKWLVDRGAMPSDPNLPNLVDSIRKFAARETGVKVEADRSRPRSADPPPNPFQPPAAESPKAAAAAEAVHSANLDVADKPKQERPAQKPDDDSRKRSAQPNRAATGEKDTVRVDRDRLDKLINTIGELVIAQSMAQQEFDEVTNHSGNSRALPELSKISRDLQQLSLSLRMVPLQGTFQKMARLVRDLSRKLDKPIDFQLHGEETELDKTVVDQLGDPLMHMVRNALDHGLETPEQRVASGKPKEGKVSLGAYYQGGNVYIELSDDGRGMNKDVILRKAIERGLVPEGQRLSDDEIYNLVFQPGFSTAQVVTDVSGRGVGMDVVRRNVEALQGNIHISTKLGSGTTFTIRLPLTLAIMDGLMLALGDDVYILPLLAVVESFCPRRSDIHVIAGIGEVVVVRGETVPLLRLHSLLGRPVKFTDPCKGILVLVEDQGKKRAILVDELLGQIQAVVKSLDSNFRRVEGIAGATILGDGRVAMILDVHGVVMMRGSYNPNLAEAESHVSEAADCGVTIGETL